MLRSQHILDFITLVVSDSSLMGYRTASLDVVSLLWKSFTIYTLKNSLNFREGLNRQQHRV